LNIGLIKHEIGEYNSQQWGSVYIIILGYLTKNIVGILLVKNLGYQNVWSKSSDWNQMYRLPLQCSLSLSLKDVIGKRMAWSLEPYF
jgi:hypothetical protein